jgi:RNA 2',3'-cyclic 3'-phosphodiesterase
LEKLRAFAGIELTAEIKSELQSIQKTLQTPQCNYVKWVEVTNLHLTLIFLGNIASTQIDPISRAFENVTYGIRAFSIFIQNVGAFPSLERPNIIWAGLQGDIKTLCAWQKNLEQKLIPLGFTPESRPFSPHLTLGRIRETASFMEKQAIGRKLQNLQCPKGAKMTVDSLNLIHSQLTPKGPFYTILRSIKLQSS